MAELSEDPKQRAGWLTMAIVGAGPTGVEIAGQVRELAQRALGTSFRRIDPGKVRVVLLDAGHEPLSHFGDRLSEIASRELDRDGRRAAHGRPGHGGRRGGGRRAEPRRLRADRRAHRDLGGRRAGIPGRGHARRRVRGDPGSRRTDRSQPGLHAPQLPRGVRDRRHGQPRQAPGRRRGGDATGATRRAGHSPFRRREARRTAGLQVPRPRQHGDRRTLPRDRQPQGPPPQRAARLADLAGRSHDRPDRLRQSLLDDASLGAGPSSVAAAASSPTAPASNAPTQRDSPGRADLSRIHAPREKPPRGLRVRRVRVRRRDDGDDVADPALSALQPRVRSRARSHAGHLRDLRARRGGDAALLRIPVGRDWTAAGDGWPPSACRRPAP